MGNVPSVPCDYCQRPAPLVTGREIYPHRPDLYGKKFYKCVPCEAWVGCHPGTETPLGRLADAPLRAAKSRVHALLDPLWRSGKAKRSTVYARLADRIGITPQQCHVGMFDLDRCAKATAELTAWRGVLPPRLALDSEVAP